MRIKIYNEIYKVKKGIPKVRGARNVIGFIDYKKRVININKNLSEREQKATLYHEIAHGILGEIEFHLRPKMKRNKTNKKKYKTIFNAVRSLNGNEAFIDALGILLQQIFDVKELKNKPISTKIPYTIRKKSILPYIPLIV